MAAEDVRMRGFRERVSVERAAAVALEGLEPRAEVAPLDDAAGRVLLEPVTADADVPAFDRSAMDGYAVRGEDTFGATTYDPVALQVVGESMPGAPCARAVGALEAVRIMTGAAVPDGADTVVPAEFAREEGGRVGVDAAFPPGKNVGRRGEDVRRGDLLLEPGRRLRPQDVGLLASVGRATARVAARPRVRILVSGNELVAAGEAAGPSRIFDSNTPMLRALVERDGGRIERALRLPDDEGAIRAALADGIAGKATREEAAADVVVAAGGTSVGREDFLPGLVRELGSLDVHGVAMRPSSPTGIGTIGATRVFLLPGNPVSCLAAYDFFAGPALRHLGGLDPGWPYAVRRARLTAPLSSQVGRTDYCRVTLDARGVTPLAVAGASVLSSTTRAHGFVVVPAGSEGHPEGAVVHVYLYDEPPAGLR